MSTWRPSATRYRITIADNASTDATGVLAARLAERHEEVRVVSLARKGRGHALKQAWSRSDAEVLVYMDVDLSTGMAALAAAGRTASLRPLGSRDRHPTLHGLARRFAA